MNKRLARQPKGQREITLWLDAMTYGGDAIGRAGGKAIFVRGGIAGELVRAEIVDERDRFARARVIDVIEPSPERVQPRCPHFGLSANSCGGCAWQHIDYAAQLRFKTDIVREQLRRIGKIADAPVRDALPSPNVWAYRNHAQFSVTPAWRARLRVVPNDAIESRGCARQYAATWGNHGHGTIVAPDEISPNSTRSANAARLAWHMPMSSV